jgi:hypothetical protein
MLACESWSLDGRFSWRIHQTKGVDSSWNGDYKAADEALTELQKQIDLI